MRFRKTIATILTFTLALGLTSCSSSDKKYVNALEDTGFEEIEYKDFKKCNPADGDFEDGVYVKSDDPKTLKKLTKQIETDVDTDDFKSLIFSQKSTDDMESTFASYVITFNSKDSAEDFFDDYSKEIKNRMKTFDSYKDYGDIATDSDDNYYIGAADIEMYGSSFSTRIGCYLDGKDVICIIMVSSSENTDDYIDLTDDFCDSLEVTSPSEAL